MPWKVTFWFDSSCFETVEWIIFSQARQYQQNDGLSAWRMYFIANEWIKLSTKRKCSIGIQILMVLLTIIVSHHPNTNPTNYTWLQAKWAYRFYITCEMIVTDIRLRLGAYVHIQIDFPLAMDIGRRPNYPERPFAGDAGRWHYRLHRLLRHTTCIQFLDLRTVFHEFGPTIYRHLLDVEHFDASICSWCIWILHPWTVCYCDCHWTVRSSAGRWHIFLVFLCVLLQVTARVCRYGHVHNATAIKARKWKHVWPPRSFAEFRAPDILLDCTVATTVNLMQSNGSVNCGDGDKTTFGLVLV